MKKFTLLAGIALLAGSGAFAANPTEINGIKISDENNTYYYRISNMRAQRLSYSNGNIYGDEGYTSADSIGHDGGLYGQPDTMIVEGGEKVVIPEIYTRPYMGLASLGGNWWLGFSAQEEVVNHNTTYWYFTDGGRKGSVQIHNAVMGGTVKRASQQVVGVNGVSRATMGFDTEGENRYYVINAINGPEGSTDLGIKDQPWYDNLSLNEQQQADAYAFCVNPTYSTTSGTCLDMNNYITTTLSAQRYTAEGEPVLNDNSEPTYYYYGFAGVDRTWSPIRTTGGDNNINHYANNGTLFFVERTEAGEVAEGEKTTDELAAEAIEAYKDEILRVLRDGAIEGAKANFSEVIDILKGWANVPMLWSDTDALNAIIDYCNNWNGEGLDVKTVVDLETREQYEAAAKKLAETKMSEAAALVGNGAVVTFRNLLAYRDINDWYQNEMNEPEANLAAQLGDAYITAGGIGTCILGSDSMELVYDGIVPTLALDENGASEWTLIPVAGTPNFLLYNEATGSYIRQYDDMFELAGGEGELGDASGVREFSWATTENKEEAAPFLLKGCPDPDAQAPVGEEEMIVMDDCGIEWGDVTNNVRLTSSFEKVTPSENEGEDPTVETINTNIHRGSKASFYKFINWGNTKNWWFADTNVFNVDLVKEGGISEVAAETVKNNAIYDLQGRRVSKAGKGIYIINGVKTLVR